MDLTPPWSGVRANKRYTREKVRITHKDDSRENGKSTPSQVGKLTLGECAHLIQTRAAWMQ